MKESSTYQEIVSIGRQNGVHEGIKKGRIEGQREYAMRALLLVSVPRLGAPSKAQRKLLESIEDLRASDEMISRQKEASSWNDLLAMARPRPRRGSASQTGKKKTK